MIQKPVEEQYNRTGLFEAIIDGLAKTGIDKTQITRATIGAVDEFHVRGREVSLELATTAGIQPGSKVLDVGCGIGGPARMLAAEYHCDVTGIDLTPEYIRTATLLSELTGLQHQTHFVQGSALQLPFADGSFDMVWTQHVQMNIADKQTFYAEIRRVLQPASKFVYYDILRTGDTPIHFPVPWADHPGISHLMTPVDLELLLVQNRLQRLSTTNETEKGMQFFVAMLERVAKQGPPAVGLNLVMGERFAEKAKNLYNNLSEGKLVVESGICEAV